MRDIDKIQDKTIQILNFKWKNEQVNPWFKKSKIMKMKDILTFKGIVKWTEPCKCVILLISRILQH